MLKSRRLVILILLIIFISGCSSLATKKDAIFQVSTIDALMKGLYDGNFSYGYLKEHGDFGIGTLEHLDGEMIGLDNKFYQIKADGIAYIVEDSTKTPFTVVKFFKVDKKVSLNKETDFAQLQKYIDSLIPSQNIFYAIKIEGKFPYIKARSVPGQQKPYPVLSEVVKTQSIFEFKDVEGILVGFRFPAYAGGVNVSGYHFHFITKDRKAGGHLLECKLTKADIEIDESLELFLELPKDKDFFKADLTKESLAKGATE